MDKKRKILIAVLLLAVIACLAYPVLLKTAEEAEPQMTTVSGGSYQSYCKPVETTASGTTGVWSMQAQTKD